MDHESEWKDMKAGMRVKEDDGIYVTWKQTENYLSYKQGPVRRVGAYSCFKWQTDEQNKLQWHIHIYIHI